MRPSPILSTLTAIRQRAGIVCIPSNAPVTDSLRASRPDVRCLERLAMMLLPIYHSCMLHAIWRLICGFKTIKIIHSLTQAPGSHLPLSSQATCTSERIAPLATALYSSLKADRFASATTA